MAGPRSPLREQLKERVDTHQKRRASTARVVQQGTELCDVAEDRRYDGPGEMPATAPTDPSAILPRVRELEQTSKDQQHVLSALEETTTVTDQRLVEAIAKLAARVGVPLSDLGL